MIAGLDCSASYCGHSTLLLLFRFRSNPLSTDEQEASRCLVTFSPQIPSYAK